MVYAQPTIVTSSPKEQCVLTTQTYIQQSRPVGADGCAGVGRALNSPSTTAAVRHQMELSSNNQSCIIHEWAPQRRRRLTSFAHHSCSSVLMLVIRGPYSTQHVSSLHHSTLGRYTALLLKGARCDAYDLSLFSYKWFCFDIGLTSHFDIRLKLGFSLEYCYFFAFIWPLYQPQWL